MLMPMSSLHVLLPLPPPNGAAAIFRTAALHHFLMLPHCRHHPTPLPHHCHLPIHPCWLLCADFIPQNARVYFIAPCDCGLSQQHAINDSTCWGGHQRHYPVFLSIEILPLQWKWGCQGEVQISWSNTWGAGLGGGLCFCKSLECGIWAILHPKMPWYYIKKTILNSILCTWNNPTFCTNTQPKMGCLRSDSRGVFTLLVPFHGAGTREKNPSGWNRGWLHLQKMNPYEYKFVYYLYMCFTEPYFWFLSIPTYLGIKGAPFLSDLNNFFAIVSM